MVKKVWLFIGDMTSTMGVFYEAYNYSRNFNLPLEIVIEDNGQSVYRYKENMEYEKT